MRPRDLGQDLLHGPGLHLVLQAPSVQDGALGRDGGTQIDPWWILSIVLFVGWVSFRLTQELRARKQRLRDLDSFDGVGELAAPRFPVTLPGYPAWNSHPHAYETLNVHIDFLMAITDVPELERIKRTQAPYIQSLTEQIMVEGIKVPLSILIDDRGHVCLEDGLHRLAVADLNGISYLPVLVRRSRHNIRRFSRPLADVFYLCWRKGFS